MITRLLLLFALACFISCNNTTNKNPNHPHAANEHMHHSSFEDLVSRFEDPSREEWQKPHLVIDKLCDFEGKTIAVLGAGTGYFSWRLAQKGANVLALDVDSRFLSHIQGKAYKNVITRKIPYDDPSLTKEEVDGVIIIDTYHHIEDRIVYFNKVLMGIKEGGKLLVVDFKKEETPNGPPIEIRLSGFEVIKELQKAGFSKVIIDTSSLPFQYIITAKKAEKR